ncbi:uncharacterized protein LOC134222655 [Armigeres subalbatus]|uniref:uncharacterized protein LOC134222655 n=1 Tax=Armigeres subalbatus TaxID=124917 RepID=UPI002ED2E081
MSNNLRELEKQDRNARKALEGMQYFLEHYEPNQVDQLPVRLQRLEEVFKEFHAVRRKIELLTDDVFDEQELEQKESDQKESKEQRKARIVGLRAEREEQNVKIVMKVENLYCKLKAGFTRLLPVANPVVQPVPQAATAAVSRVKLPEIRLPSFSGQLREWLTATDKFTYLRSSLTEEALQEINSVEVTEATRIKIYSTLFLKMKIPDRSDAVRRTKLCFNCLSAGHQAKSCVKGCCHHCQQKHHSLLHPESISQQIPPVTSPVPSQTIPRVSIPQQQSQSHSQGQYTHHQTTQPSTSALPITHSPNTQLPSTTNQTCTDQNNVSLPVCIQNRTGDVLLSTAIINIKDQYGATRLARALLDSCSQFCFMTTAFSQKLNLRGFPDYLEVQGIGGLKSISRRRVTACVLPRFSNVLSYNEDMSFYVLPELTTTLPAKKVNIGRWKPPSHMVLADPQFFEPGPIDVIIGAEFFFDLLTDGRNKIYEGGPTLQNTVFGWIVSGQISSRPTNPPQTVSLSCTLADIHNQLAHFWELESCKSNSIQSVEESTCETIYDETTTRNDSGKFVVSLPKKEFVMQLLGESEAIATKRFLALERRLEAQPELKNQYHQFIHEYEQLGHMKLVDSGDAEFPVYFLPHHAVLKPDSTTTKLRVVFDASCKTSTGVSLNDALMTGPVVQDDLMSIQLRFRLHRIAIMADVEKMYRMILVYPSDQRLQCILWRKSTREPIRTYQLTTVTYGTACAPYLATKSLQRLSELGSEMYPLAARALKNDFYVDDMLTGADNIETASQMMNEMIKLTSSGGFNLRKWSSNSSTLLDLLPDNLISSRPALELDSASTLVKTLGLLWDTSTDCFIFRSPDWNKDAVITKRVVLADTARLFDPLGLVGPVIVTAKIFVQELWKEKCDWDDPLPKSYSNFWIEYRRNLSALSSLSIPRKAYGACLYLRSTTFSGSVEIRLITAKSKVAPLEDLKRKKKGPDDSSTGTLRSVIAGSSLSEVCW